MPWKSWRISVQIMTLYTNQKSILPLPADDPRCIVLHLNSIKTCKSQAPLQTQTIKFLHTGKIWDRYSWDLKKNVYWQALLKIKVGGYFPYVLVRQVLPAFSCHAWGSLCSRLHKTEMNVFFFRCY